MPKQRLALRRGRCDAYQTGLIIDYGGGETPPFFVFTPASHAKESPAQGGSFEAVRWKAEGFAQRASDVAAVGTRDPSLARPSTGAPGCNCLAPQSEKACSLEKWYPQKRIRQIELRRFRGKGFTRPANGTRQPAPSTTELTRRGRPIEFSQLAVAARGHAL